jgi:hypothetical protein
VTGDPNSDMRSYKKVDARTLKMVVKKNGKITATGRIIVSDDGKSCTVTTSGTDTGGKRQKHSGVRQAVAGRSTCLPRHPAVAYRVTVTR